MRLFTDKISGENLMKKNWLVVEISESGVRVTVKSRHYFRFMADNAMKKVQKSKSNSIFPSTLQLMSQDEWKSKQRFVSLKRLKI